MRRRSATAARTAIAVAAAVLAAIVIAGCGTTAGSSKEPVRYGASDLRGEPVATGALRGRPVLLSSWATWCTACRDELPKLERLYEQRRADGLQVVAVNLDSSGPSRDVRRMVAQYGLTMPIWSDAGNDFSGRFRAIGVPTTVLLDRRGRLVRVWQGGIDPADGDSVRALDAALRPTTDAAS